MCGRITKFFVCFASFLGFTNLLDFYVQHYAFSTKSCFVKFFLTFLCKDSASDAPNCRHDRKRDANCNKAFALDDPSVNKKTALSPAEELQDKPMQVTLYTFLSCWWREKGILLNDFVQFARFSRRKGTWC